MKLPRISSKLYVYQRVILVFTALFVPVYLVNLSLNMTGLSYIKKQYSDSVQSNARFYANQLNVQLTFIRNLQFQFVNDSDVQRLSFLANSLKGYEQVPYITRISERLNAIHNSSDYLIDVGVYIKSIDREISTSGGVTDRSEWIAALFGTTPDESSDLPLFISNGRLFLVQYANNDSIVSYMELSLERIESTLALLSSPPDSGAFLVDNNGKLRFPPVYKEELIDQIIRAEGQMPSGGSEVIESEHNRYTYTSYPIYPLGITLYTYMNQNELTDPLRKMNTWFLLLSLLSILVVIVYSVVIHRMIHKPLKELISAFKKVEADKIDVVLSAKHDNEFGYLYRSFDRMVDRLRQTIRTNYEQKLALGRSELKQLQSQINPHFLYNGFYNLYMMCKAKDYDNLAILTQKLGSYYQFITRSGADEVPFHLEYKHAIDYAEIQRIRFSNRISIASEPVPSACSEIRVPRLIIQPAIENSFEHAFGNNRRGGNLYVTVSFEQSILQVGIEDDGTMLSDEMIVALQKKLANPSAAEEKTGIINACMRLRLKYGESSGIRVCRSPYGGLKTVIFIDANGGGGPTVQIDDR